MDGSRKVYAAVIFSTAGRSLVNSIAQWNGTSWAPLGTGLDILGHIYALAVDCSGNLYAGGQFSAVGGVAANYIAKWNGTSWTALGPGLGRGQPRGVYTLAVDGSDNVYAGGAFTTAGGIAANHIAKWNGISWSILGTGLNSDVLALMISGNNVIAGGYFTTVGDGSKVTAYFGIYHQAGPTATLPTALAAQVALYPNPARAAVFLELSAALGRAVATATLVYALGRVVCTTPLPARGAATYSLSLVGVAPGSCTPLAVLAAEQSQTVRAAGLAHLLGAGQPGPEGPRHAGSRRNLFRGRTGGKG